MQNWERKFNHIVAIKWLKIATLCDALMCNDPEYYLAKKTFAIGKYDTLLNKRN